MAAYEAAQKGKPLPIGVKNVQSGSMADLIAKYYGSAAFLGLERSTQQVYRRIIEKLREDHGHRAVVDLEAKYIRILAARIQKPTAAKRFISVLRILLGHAVECGMIDRNPAEGIKGPRVKTVGFHSWTEEEIAQFEAHHAPGTRERLAVALLLYTGQRRSDVVRMGPQHVRDGVLRIVQKKTGAELSIPVHPELAAIIDVSKGEHMAFLVTAQGKPFTAAGFGNWFREACNVAGLPHCSAHGLRKAAARRLADAGATEHEIASITGHESLREVERYAKARIKRGLQSRLKPRSSRRFRGRRVNETRENKFTAFSHLEAKHMKVKHFFEPMAEWGVLRTATPFLRSPLS